MRNVSLKTISGRFIFMALLFLIVTGGLTILVTTQNRNSSRTLTIMQEVRIPIRLTSGNVIGSIDRVMSLQRAYMLSGNTQFKEDRLKVYKSEIYPAAETLSHLKKSLNEEEAKAITDIEIKVKEFEKVQNEILNYFEKNALPPMKQIEKANEQEWQQMTEVFIAKLKADRELSDQIKLANTLRDQLLKLVTDLRNSEEKQLTNEVSFVTTNMSRSQFIVIATSVLILVFLIVLTIVNIRSLRRSIQKPVELINVLASGELPERIDESTDELNEILNAGKRLASNIQSASQFALAIGEGNLEKSYKEASEKDVLGKSLLHMRDRLKEIALEEQRRNWTTAGIAELGNILRATSNSEQLYLNILSYMIKYVKANQGALYMVDRSNNQTLLRMVSCYAYNKKKFIDQVIEPGYGLVGQAYLEKQPIFIKEVPKDFVRITSGLGEALPRTVLISPLLINNEVFGILEMATFKEFEDHERSFVSLASEQIASVISTAITNERTSLLLKESQQQTEELRSQEEEMRQNMEELSATQEEMARKEREYMNRIKLLEESLLKETSAQQPALG
ncbi:MAG: GAF domain-containing protein [Bacteroidetes bacterium]|nr:GAF domain-containing protein [Bacteroidota bacterium]